MKRIHLI